MQNPVLKNVETGQIIELVKSPFTIGRSLTSDYVIENKIVSRIHCSLTNMTEGWTLTDSSTNGTLVNDGHYKGETSPILKHHDEICLGYQSYTYRFITEGDKIPNSQVEKLKNQDIMTNTIASNEPQSPGTPHSFDENGVSDDILNNLADNILDSVEQQTNIDEQPATSTVMGNIITSDPPHSDNMTSNKSNIAENNLGEAQSTNNIHYNIPVQVNNRNELNKQNNDSDERLQSQGNSSISTIIYSLAEEIDPEVAQPVTDNREEQPNINVEQNEVIGAAQENAGSANAPVSVASVSTSVPNIISKPKNLLSECIEAVVQRYSESAPTNSTFAASTSGQCNALVSSTITTPVPTASISLASPINYNKKVKVMAASSGVISQLKPVAGQSLTAYTLGAGQQVPVVRRLTENEMQRILTNQPGIPVVILDKPPIRAPAPSTLRTNNNGIQSTNAGSRRISGNTRADATVTSASVSQSSANSSAKITILGGIRSIHNSSLPLSTRNRLKRALRNYEQYNPGTSNTTAGNSVLFSGNAMLQAAEDQNTSGSCTARIYTSAGGTMLMPANSMLQAARESQNSTGSSTIMISRNTPLQSVGVQNITSQGTVLVSGKAVENQALPAGSTGGGVSASNNDVIESSSVPVAAHEVVIENTAKSSGDVEVTAGSTNANQNFLALKCHDSLEPGPSKAQDNFGTNDLQNNQNQFEHMENELMCTICANLFIKAVTLGCSHSFCQYCIEEWKKKKIECPICRNKITSTTRTLVLDNVIEKMMETASEEDKQDRKSAVEERKKIDDAETAKKNEQNARKNSGRGANRARRGRRNANTRGNNSNAAPVITIADSPSTTDSDNSSNNDDYDYDVYYSDDWYNGDPDVYYGGYGRCYTCGGRGHWANGCPYR